MKIPEDMIAGTIHKTNNYGDLEIVRYVKCTEIEVKFISTGYSTCTQSSHIRRGSVMDRTCIESKVGTIHKTNSCGKLKIIRIRNVRNVEVEFLLTGYKTIATLDNS